MRLILVIVTFVQLQASNVKELSNYSSKLKVPPGIYELRRISNDELGSIKSDRIVTVQQGQRIFDSKGASPLHTTRNEYSREYDGNSQSRVMLASTASGRQDYTQIQRQYQNQRNSQKDQKNYYVVNQISTSSAVSVSAASTGVSQQNYLKSHKGYQPQESPQNYRLANDNSKSQMLSVLDPGRRPSYQVVKDIPERRPQEVLENYQVFNEGGTQGYTTRKVQRPQQYTPNYQVVNEKSALGGTQISLPGYGGVGSALEYTQAQYPQNFQAINDKSEQGAISLSAPDSAQNYPKVPAGYTVAQEQQQYLQNPQAISVNSEQRAITILLPGNREYYPQAQGGYTQVQEPQEDPQNYQQASENFQPAGVSNYPQVQEGYNQVQGLQQDPQNYQIVNQNSAPGGISISLLSNEQNQDGYTEIEGLNQYLQNSQAANGNSEPEGITRIYPQAQHRYRPMQGTPQYLQNSQVTNGNSKLGGETQYTSDGYQIVNEDPVANVVSVPASGSNDDQTQMVLVPDNGREYTLVQNAQPNPTNENPAGSGQYYIQSQNAMYTPPEGSFISQDQQPEAQYDVHRPQRDTIQTRK